MKTYHKDWKRNTIYMVLLALFAASLGFDGGVKIGLLASGWFLLGYAIRRDYLLNY